MLHCLDGASVVEGCPVKTRWQLLHFVAVGMPDINSARQTLEKAITVGLDFKKTSFTLRALITFAGRQSFHQPDGRPKGQGYLLMSATDA